MKRAVRPWQSLSGGVAMLCALALGGAPLPAGESFSVDVMAVLSKAGCNRGTCHGNRSGKGGFKLSLRGQDPDWDFNALTRDVFGRRVNRSDPDGSLLLLKPLGKVSHGGGVRFGEGSLEDGILRRWVNAGCPRDAADLPALRGIEVTPREEVLVEPRRRLQLRVEATFDDGSRRDVTRLAVYESADNLATITPGGEVHIATTCETTVLVRYLDARLPVRLTLVPERPGFVWKPPPVHNTIDHHVFDRLRVLRIEPSELAPDRVFLRRAFLDLLGIPPTVDEIREFLADERPDRRARLVDRLLKRPEFAEFWALKWSDLLRCEEKVLDAKGVENFHHWIRRSIADGKRMDQFARELIAARGSTYRRPPANFYRALRDPISRAETVAQVFLGTRLRCARCHNHPFERWSQDDYYSWAGLFARVRYKIVENRRRDRNDGHEFRGEQIVWLDREGEVDHPLTGEPARPRFLGAGRAELEPHRDRLEALADWITGPSNPFFAKVLVNRIWYHLMGRGLVDPVDDFRITNPSTHPALLDALARDFVDHGFDLRHMIRLIMSSRTYQLSSVPGTTNRDDRTHYSRAILRRLTAEQLLDSVSQVLGAAPSFNGYPPGTRAGQIRGVQAVRARDQSPAPGDQFLRLFGKPPRLFSSECERSRETTLGQAFQLIGGPALNDLLTRAENRLSRLLASGRPDAEIIEELYLAALAREPEAAELEAALSLLKRSADRRNALEDIVWGLLNAKEFLFRL